MFSPARTVVLFLLFLLYSTVARAATVSLSAIDSVRDSLALEGVMGAAVVPAFVPQGLLTMLFGEGMEYAPMGSYLQEASE